MKIVCREVDKYSNRRTLYYIVPVKFRAGLMRDLYLRELLNPELKYFITKLDEKIREKYNIEGYELLARLPLIQQKLEEAYSIMVMADRKGIKLVPVGTPKQIKKALELIEG